MAAEECPGCKERVTKTDQGVSNAKFSDLPCKYKIKEVSFEMVSGREMIRVELSCCYLGDVAYFDKETKNLVKISYGAK